MMNNILYKWIILLNVQVNIELDKTRKIVENTLQKYEQKYGGVYYHRIVKVMCVAKF